MNKKYKLVSKINLKDLNINDIIEFLDEEDDFHQIHQGIIYQFESLDQKQAKILTFVQKEKINEK